MKSERLAYAFGKINDDLIYGAVNDTKKKYGWRRCAQRRLHRG